MYNNIANTMISTSHASRVHGYTVVLFGMEFLILIPVMSIWRYGGSCGEFIHGTPKLGHLRKDGGYPA